MPEEHLKVNKGLSARKKVGGDWYLLEKKGGGDWRAAADKLWVILKRVLLPFPSREKTELSRFFD